MSHQIICFGETLWDMLPSGHLPGGAPMNVAIHLKNQQFEPLVLSRVGTDDLGVALVAFLHSQGLSTRYIQVGQTHLTGVVKVNLDNKQEVSYKIVEPVAWDYIQYDEEAARQVAASDVFIFGSLASRSYPSRTTLLQYLALAKFKVFDVNLRPPHYTPEGILRLLDYADVVKMNHQELALIAAWLELAGEEAHQMAALLERFQLQALIVTRGENGAAALTGQGYVQHPGFQVEVEDTIGSGDAFLATFLAHYLRHQPLAACLHKACLVGSYVATCPGATPNYTPQLLEEFLLAVPQ